MTTKLANYLRSYRKRSGLSQDDIAFLMGCQSVTQLARYENCSRLPQLRNAFALEVILNAQARALFAGLFEDADRVVAERARTLLEFAERSTSAKRTAALKAIAEGSVEDPEDRMVWEPV